MNYIDNFIRQFKEEIGENSWTVVEFLEYLKLNNYYLVKDDKTN